MPHESLPAIGLTSSIPRRFSRHRLAQLISCCVLSALAAPSAPAQTVADPNAAAGRKPLIDAARNGVPLVHIAPPSAAGVSRNQFSQFNVGPSGLILNNSSAPVQTQLGGWVGGNPQLGPTSARVIVNEVTGTSPTSLRGAMEVAGPAANLVTANPNGISCDGCGFINTAGRVSLVTGTLQYDASGAVTHAQVPAGVAVLEVGPGGLSVSDLDQLDLIARGIVVEGSVWAGKVQALAGVNQVRYGDLSRSSGNASGEDLTHTNTRIDAATVSLQSGADTELRGAVVNADTVQARIGGDLRITSPQDTRSWNEQSSSAGASLTVGASPNLSLSAGRTDITSQYASVSEQSALRAGDGGFQVEVQGSTALTGGAITSTQQAVDQQRNRFTSQGGVSTQDVNNSASYDARSTGITASLGTGPDPAGRSTPGGSAGTGHAAGSASSITEAAISGIAGNANARTGDASTGLAPIFDAQTIKADVQAQVAITAEFGRQASKAWADYAQRQRDTAAAQARQALQTGDTARAQQLAAEAQQWDEGGAYRTAGHTALGALSGGAQGAAGAAASAALMPEIGRLIDATDAPAAVRQGLGMAVSAALGSVVGGVQGAASAFNADTNNRQLHPSEIKWIADQRADFASRLSDLLERPVTELEAMYWLTVAGESNVDQSMQRSNAQFVRGTSNSEDARAYDAAKAFIAAGTRSVSAAFVDERGAAQTLFGTRNGEFYRPEVYSQWRNDAGYRDYYWTVLGVNLLPERPTAQEQATWEQREAVVREQQVRQLALLGVQGLAARLVAGVAARAGETAPAAAPKPTPQEQAATERARQDNNVYAADSRTDPARAVSPGFGDRSALEIGAAEARQMIEARLPLGATVVKVEAGNALNAQVIADNPLFRPPYLSNSEAITFKTTTPEQFVRVYVDTPNKSAQVGNWMFRESDIRGLTAEQIASKYSLPQVPNRITDVTVPAGQILRVTVASDVQIRAGIAGNGGGGGVQFEVMSAPKDPDIYRQWLTNSRALK
jgi:filamentous hemagglutinin family protein